jgi:DNA (cytosine-5)-methyltransferase 1
MGGISLAARQLGMQVVVGVDADATAVRTFEKNFPEAEAIEGSIRSSLIIDRCAELLKPPEGGPSMVVSGPPCQGFSVAGSRDPSDPRNQILIAVARDIVTLAPDCALVENVAAVLAEEHAQRLQKFYDILADGQYFVTSLVLDASEFGVAQKRKRAFFFILRRQVTTDELLKRLEDHKQPVISVELALQGLPSPLVRPDDYSDERDYGGVHNHFAMQHSQRVVEKIAALLPGSGPMSYRRLNATQPSNTLFSGHRAPPAHFSDPRSITTREAARLQGFPDDFRVYGSFGNQMAQVTNAVPPPLARAVLQVLTELSGMQNQ